MKNVKSPIKFYKTKASAARAFKSKHADGTKFDVVETPKGWMARMEGTVVPGFNKDGTIDLRDGAQMGIIASIAAIVTGEYNFDGREPLGNENGVTVNEVAEFIAGVFNREVRGVKGTVRTQLSKLFGDKGLNKVRDGREVRYMAA